MVLGNGGFFEFGLLGGSTISKFSSKPVSEGVPDALVVVEIEHLKFVPGSIGMSRPSHGSELIELRKRLKMERRLWRMIVISNFYGYGYVCPSPSKLQSVTSDRELGKLSNEACGGSTVGSTR